MDLKSHTNHLLVENFCVTKGTHPYFSRGVAYGKLGKYKLALLDFDEAIIRLPRYGEAYFERSAIYKAIGKLELSRSDLKSAKEFGCEAPEAMK